MKNKNQNRELLEGEIQSEIKKISSMKPGTEEHSAAVESLAKLYKLDVDHTQVREQKWERYVRYGLETAGLVLPLVFYGVWMKRGFKFEETGTYTSTTFRGLFNRFRPTRK